MTVTNQEVMTFCKVLEDIKFENKDEKVNDAIQTINGEIAKKIPKAKIVRVKKVKTAL